MVHHSKAFQGKHFSISFWNNYLLWENMGRKANRPLLSPCHAPGTKIIDLGFPQPRCKPLMWSAEGWEFTSLKERTDTRALTIEVEGETRSRDTCWSPATINSLLWISLSRNRTETTFLRGCLLSVKRREYTQKIKAQILGLKDSANVFYSPP